MKKYIIIATLVLSGCSLSPSKPSVDKLVYVSTPLYAPARPKLPTWGYDDISCLSQEMIQKILDRDTLRKEYIEQLEVIIKETQK